jgi:hypothetical protein
VPRDSKIQVAVDAITAARVALRAQEAGLSVSGYVADLIARDGDQGLADALAVEQLEMQLLTAILVRALLAAARGEEASRKVTERAREKAVAQARDVLADLRAFRSRS